jgi:hypothetical protein
MEIPKFKSLTTMLIAQNSIQQITMQIHITQTKTKNKIKKWSLAREPLNSKHYISQVSYIPRVVEYNTTLNPQ